LRRHPEVQTVVSLVGGTEDGDDPGGFKRVRFFVVFKPRKDWPGVLRQELGRKFPGVHWSFSATYRDSFEEAFTAAPGEGLLKIFGPDLAELEKLAEKVRDQLRTVKGIENVGVVNRIMGKTNLEFRVDPDKCKKWGISVAEVNQFLALALAPSDRVISQMVEGERPSPIVLRLSLWPKWRRSSVLSILDIPLDISNNTVVPVTGPGLTPSATGSGPPTARSLSQTNTANPLSNSPRLRLRDLVTPLDREGKPDPKGDFLRAGVVVIYREDGQRMIAVRYGVRDRDEATIRAEAKKKTEHLFKAPYRARWGER
jgi:cobalt-zinc-cadmium resistance protein CzcA